MIKWGDNLYTTYRLAVDEQRSDFIDNMYLIIEQNASKIERTKQLFIELGLTSDDASACLIQLMKPENKEKANCLQKHISSYMKIKDCSFKKAGPPFNEHISKTKENLKRLIQGQLYLLLPTCEKVDEFVNVIAPIQAQQIETNANTFVLDALQRGPLERDNVLFEKTRDIRQSLDIQRLPKPSTKIPTHRHESSARCSKVYA